MVAPDHGTTEVRALVLTRRIERHRNAPMCPCSASILTRIGSTSAQHVGAASVLPVSPCPARTEAPISAGPPFDHQSELSRPSTSRSGLSSHRSMCPLFDRFQRVVEQFVLKQCLSTPHRAGFRIPVCRSLLAVCPDGRRARLALHAEGARAGYDHRRQAKADAADQHVSAGSVHVDLQERIHRQLA